MVLAILTTIEVAPFGLNFTVTFTASQVASNTPNCPLLVDIPYSLRYALDPSWNNEISEICIFAPSTICTKYLAER